MEIKDLVQKTEDYIRSNISYQHLKLMCSLFYYLIFDLYKVVLIIVSYMLMKRRKRLSDNDDPESPPVSRRQRSSLEKRSRSIEKH